MAAKEFVRPGWRSDIYQQQLEAIQRVQNLPEDFLSLDSVDQDISYSPNGPRQLVYSGLKEPAVLARVARRQIHQLMKFIQIDGMREATPPVYETRTNPLADILDDAYEVREDNDQNWDEFLASSIPPKFSAPPISDDAFHADRLVNSDVNMRIKTLVIGPQRLLDGLDENRFTLIPYAEKEKLPVDIVIRMDVTPVVAETLLRLGGTPKTHTKPAVAYPDVSGV